MFKVGDDVRVRYGVLYQGYDLTDKKGVIKDTTSYLMVYIPEYKITCKLFQHEVEHVKSSIGDIFLAFG